MQGNLIDYGKSFHYLVRPCHNIEHDINLKKGARPVTAKARRLFGPKLEAAKAEIEVMLRLGIIRHSKSEWASPLHVVPKGNGAFRPCGDFRELNSITVPDKYPLPQIYRILQEIFGMQLFLVRSI